MDKSADSIVAKAAVEVPDAEKVEELVEQIAPEGPSSEEVGEMADQAVEASAEAIEVEKLLIDPKCLKAVHIAARERCVSVEDVAAELGASRETVSGCLNALADLGLVAQGPGERYCHYKVVKDMAEKIRRAVEQN